MCVMNWDEEYRTKPVDLSGVTLPPGSAFYLV